MDSTSDVAATSDGSLRLIGGDLEGHGDVVDANAELTQRALQRYKLLEGSDFQLQAAHHDGDKISWLIENCPSCIQMVEGVCKAYAERTIFGFCAPGSDEWHSLTYSQLFQRVVDFAGGVRALGAFQTGDFVGVCGFSSLDWVTADFANLYLGATTVPLPTNIQAEDIVKIINEAELRCLICSFAEVGSLGPLLCNCTTVKSLIVMDLPTHIDPTAESVLQKVDKKLGNDCLIQFFPSVLALGEETGAPPMIVPGQDGHRENPVISLFYTSGSTGLPKGAIFRDRMWHQYWCDAAKSKMHVPIITLGFLPLNHLGGRQSLIMSMMSGGSTYFVRRSDMSTFFEDIKFVRPTVLMVIPRIANMIYDQMQRVISQSDIKQNALQRFREETLGGRLLFGATGTAPSAPEVIDFLSGALLIPIFESYGSTEAGMLTKDGFIEANVLEWKLVDVPELDYYIADQPFPRGELLVRSKTMIDGYYKHQEVWEEMIKENGCMETGDIMEQRGPNRLIWIDRKKNILKLSQGEFVSLGRLEATYSGSTPVIDQIYIYGSSLHSHLLAVVVPSEAASAQFKGEELKRELRHHMDDLARQKALQGYEIPRDFVVELEPFSKINHLLTDSGKPARGKLKAKYGPVCEDMYKAMEVRQKERQAKMRDAASHTSVQEKVQQAVSIALGVDLSELGDSNSTFNELGGDSLAAIQFAREVDELCGSHLPVSFVLDQSHCIADIIHKVESLLNDNNSDVLNFENIHGRANRTILAKDLDLGKFAPNGLPVEVTTAIAADELPAAPVKVLVTGANGFLGRFLLLDFLKRISTRAGGWVVALVRGASDDAAFSRLRSGYDSGDAELLSLFDQLAKGRLRVYSGDLSLTNFGLKPEIYRELAQSVDTVIHNGALVNHAFTYEQLFEPNVLGSVEVMKFAVRYKRKALTFMSSVGVAAPLGRTEVVSETELGALLSEKYPASGGYAFGYGCSKWATEVQLQQLHNDFDIPISIVRCGMILAHSRYLGQQNPTDMFTRLLASLIYTRIAPVSFYKEPSSLDNHYDGMPVDFVAEGIAGIASAHRKGISLYHMDNSHWEDNVTLDSFVDWIESAGYNLRRYPDYAAWYADFKLSLEKLDSRSASHSSLPIVYQWEQQLSGRMSSFDTSQMRIKIKETTAWKDIPHLDEAFIHQNIRNLIALHIISPSNNVCAKGL